jgi:tetratricopeptide (TPR) repeat protein
MDDALNLIERSSEARRNGDHETAIRLAEAAMETARCSNDLNGRGSALAQLARLRRDERRPDAAVKLYEEAAGIAREQGDFLALAHRLRHIGDVSAEQGDLGRAEECYDEAGHLFEAYGTGQLTMANFLRSKALLREKQGANAAAVQLWTDARVLYAASGIDAGVEESDRRLMRLSS